MDAVQAAENGHPGTPMALAPAAWLLWTRHLKHDPHDPGWPDRDRFVLSCGHASMLLYSLLYLTGYDLPLEQIKQFRQWGSQTPGHPEHGITPGVETTTGPLGQGIANAVGMAIAEQLMASRFNQGGHEPVNHRTWVFASDGDMMEGVSHEACSLAGHLQLGKLKVIYDDNDISIDGHTGITFTEDVGARFEAYGWHVLHVDDGNDLEAIDRALTEAAAETGRPSLIVLKTIIGYPAPTKQNTPKAHGEALGPEEIRKTKEILGWPLDQPFYVPPEVTKATEHWVTRGKKLHDEWNARFAEFRAIEGGLARQFDAALAGALQVDWDKALPTFPTDKPLATRQASGATLEALIPLVPELAGGSADLAGSTGTGYRGAVTFAPGHPGRNLAWGVREHGMGSALNGMALHGGIRPYGSTFFIFSDYMRPAIRLAALTELRVIYLFTHDSVGLGEDGPTHQPVEHLASLRAMPNLSLIRPGDATETAEAWRAALERRDGPTALVLTRQKIPVLDRSAAGMRPARGLAQGGYVLFDPPGANPQAILLSSGSELHLALAAAQRLTGDGVPTRVVSLPSWDLFRKQPASYRDTVLPPALRVRVSIEAAAPLGWREWVGDAGESIGLTHFGASAPAERLFQEFGITIDAAVAAVRRVLTKVGP